MNATADKTNVKPERDRSSVISIRIKDKQALYLSYMPYVQGGGLFVPTTKDFNLGDELFLLVKLMDEREPLKISAKIVWLNPIGTSENRPAGIGVQFLGESAKKATNLIEDKLGTALSSTRNTHTM